MKHQFNKLRYNIAKAAYYHEIPTALFLATAIGVGGSALIYEEHKYDNFSNKDTVLEVQDLNNQITELNTKYIEANKEDILYSDRKEIIKDIEYDLTLLEHDLLSSPISETSAENVLETFNGKSIADEYKLTTYNHFKGLNDLKEDFNPSDYSNTLSGKIEYVNDLKEKGNGNIDFQDNPVATSLLFAVATLTFGVIPFFGAFLLLENMGRPKILDNKTVNRRKKKLSIASKGDNKL